MAARAINRVRTRVPRPRCGRRGLCIAGSYAFGLAQRERALVIPARLLGIQEARPNAPVEAVNLY